MKKCIGINSAGNACGLRAMEGSDYCRFHQDQAVEVEEATTTTEETTPRVALVKVGKVPGRIEEYAVNGNPTVGNSLEAAGLSETEGFEIRLNGAPAQLEKAVEDGDVVLLVPKIKGNQSIVKVGKVPGRIGEYGLADGATVAGALSVAEISDLEGFEIRLNGALATQETVVSDGDVVLLVPKIKGN